MDYHRRNFWKFSSKNPILGRNLPIDGVKQILRTGISAIEDFLLVSVKKGI